MGHHHTGESLVVMVLMKKFLDGKVPRDFIHQSHILAIVVAKIDRTMYIFAGKMEGMAAASSSSSLSGKSKGSLSSSDIIHQASEMK